MLYSLFFDQLFHTVALEKMRQKHFDNYRIPKLFFFLFSLVQNIFTIENVYFFSCIILFFFFYVLFKASNPLLKIGAIVVGVEGN
jgi:uncharacterized membrane protein